MKNISLLLVASMLPWSWLAAEETFIPGHSTIKDYEAFNTDFIEFYCFDCHGDGMKKGGFSMDDLGPLDETNTEKWKSIWAQVALKEMPPKDEEQPEVIERLQFSHGIVSNFKDLMKDKGGFHDHEEAKRGNFVDHDLLFSPLFEGIKLLPTASPKRIWRVTPSEHITRLNELVNTEPKYDPSKPGYRSHGDAVPVNHAGELKLYYGLDNIINWSGGSVAYDTAISNTSGVLASAHEHGFENYPSHYSVNSAETIQILEKAQQILKYMAYGPHSIVSTQDQITDDATEYQLNRKKGDDRGSPSSITYDTKFRRPDNPLYHLLKDTENQYTVENVRVVIADLFERLTFRSPHSSELDKYFKLVEKTVSKLGKEQGLIVGLSAIFLDRDALFRSELGEGLTADEYGRVMLQDWELGLALNHALSYIRPDQTLRRAITEGKMRTKEDVKREITRMLDDDSIRKPRVLQFFREYFDYDLAGYNCKDNKAVKDAGVAYRAANLSKAMHGASASTDRLVEIILDEDKDVLKQLLTTQKIVIAQEDVVFYGKMRNEENNEIIQAQTAEWKAKRLKAKKLVKEAVKHREKVSDREQQLKVGSPEWRKVCKELFEARFNFQRTGYHVAQLGRLAGSDVKQIKYEGSPIFARITRPTLALQSMTPERKLTTAPEGERLGILTTPAWLVSHSDAMDNHAIHRGIWVRERLLGGGIPDVPITVDAQLPDEPNTTLRSRMRVTKEKYCWSCHEKMDPLGLTFEMYNHMGVFREMEHHKPVDTSGRIIASGDPKLDGPVKDAFEMIHKLANSERVEQVFIRHAFRFWMGRNETLHDAPVLQAAHKAYKDSGGSMKALITSLVTSDAFLYRR